MSPEENVLNHVTFIETFANQINQQKHFSGNYIFLSLRESIISVLHNIPYKAFVD